MSQAATAEAEVLLAQWVVQFNTRQPELLVPLYAEDATLHGTSQPQLNHGLAQIRAYFRGTSTVRLGAYVTQPLSDDAVLFAGHCVFTRQQDGRDIETPSRFTFVMQRRGADWRILHHHSSREPA